MEKPLVSIIIPTKILREETSVKINTLIKLIFNSWEGDPSKIEILVINSSSWPNFKNTYKNVNYIVIPPQTFNHGRTRNLGAEKANGKYIAFITDDVFPTRGVFNEMSNRLASDELIAGVFTCQRPQKNASLLTQIKQEFYYPQKSRINSVKSSPQVSFSVGFFSNCCSMIPRDLLLKYPFNDALLMSEDLEWAIRMLKLGFKTYYLTHPFVYHSHEFNAIKEFRRMVDDGYSKRQIAKISKISNIRENSTFFMQSFRVIIKKNDLSLSKKLIFLIGNLFQNIIRSMGYVVGYYLYSEKWLLPVKKRLSGFYNLKSKE